MKIFLIRTYQPHWSAYTGIHQFIQYIDRSRFDIFEEVIDRRPSKNKPIRGAYRKLSDIIRIGGPTLYKIGDLIAEVKGIRSTLTDGYDAVFYLDGEHSIHYLPKFFGKMKLLDKRPKIFAMFHQPPQKLSSLINLNLIKYLDCCIVLTSYQADFLSSYIPNEKIVVVPHGVNTDYFFPRRRRSEEHKFICLSVGSWMRDYTTAFDVAGLLIEEKDIEFHIVSSSVEPPRGLKNVYMHRNIPDNELLMLYQKASVLFMPLYDATANNVLLEALSCGLPVITSAIPGAREYLDKYSGMLVSNGKNSAFAHHISDLYRNPDTLDKMRLAARSNALKFSWPVVSSRIEEVLSKYA